jgi:hypothetical protein
MDHTGSTRLRVVVMPTTSGNRREKAPPNGAGLGSVRTSRPYHSSHVVPFGCSTATARLESAVTKKPRRSGAKVPN